MNSLWNGFLHVSHQFGESLWFVRFPEKLSKTLLHETWSGQSWVRRQEIVCYGPFSVCIFSWYVCVDLQQKKGGEEIGLNRGCQWICSQWNLFQLGLVWAFSWQQVRLNWGTWLVASGLTNLTRIQHMEVSWKDGEAQFHCCSLCAHWCQPQTGKNVGFW